MKTLVLLIVAMGLACAYTVPTFAGDAPSNKADCAKAGKKWDDKSKTCASASGY